MPRLDDGFSTLITFEDNTAVKLYQKTVTPPGASAGGPNPTTTMHNTRWRTNQPKKLITLLQSGFVAAYDPTVYDEIIALLGINQKITVEYPDGVKLEFYGWLDEFKPNEMQEGEQPTAQILIESSNETDTATPVETGPSVIQAPV